MRPNLIGSCEKTRCDMKLKLLTNIFINRPDYETI